MAKYGMWRPLAWLMVVGTAQTLALPAGAQFFEDRYPSEQRARRQQPQHQQPFFNNFPFFYPNERQQQPYRPSYTRPAQPVDSSKAPAPRKQEAPPTSTVVVLGDSMADWLGYGLEEALSDSPQIGIVRKIRPNSGLIRYEPRSDTPDWPQALKDLLPPEKPSAIVVMLGLNDRQQIRERAPQPQPQTQPQPGGDQPAAPVHEPPRAAAGASFEFRTDKWAEAYAKRIDDMIAALKSRGVPVLWVGLPSTRGQRATSDDLYLDDLYRTRAEKAGIAYVDVWDGFVDESGRYTVQGPDFEGQIRRLRTGDGVHFTKAGAVKLAHFVERELRRALSKSVVPVALPSPEEPLPAPAAAAKPGGPAPRPAVGPVVPLTTTTGDDDQLLGGGGRSATPAPVPDPTAARVLVRGEAVAAPTGRADNFAWPPPAAVTPDAEPAPAPAPVVVAPAVPAAKSVPKDEAKKPKTDASNQPAPDVPPPRTRKSPRADLGNPPRPPAPIGSSAR